MSTWIRPRKRPDSLPEPSTDIGAGRDRYCGPRAAGSSVALPRCSFSSVSMLVSIRSRRSLIAFILPSRRAGSSSTTWGAPCKLLGESGRPRFGRYPPVVLVQRAAEHRCVHDVGRLAVGVGLAAADGDEQAVVAPRVGHVPPLERRDFRAPQPGHEEQPGDDAVDGRTRFGPFRGLEPAAGAPPRRRMQDIESDTGYDTRRRWPDGVLARMSQTAVCDRR